VKSLDPRVKRLPEIGTGKRPSAVDIHDQFETFEVFVQPKPGKPFQHEGAIHAPNLEMAYIFAKENFTRRFTCISLFVVETRNVHVSAMTEGNQNVYDVLTQKEFPKGEKIPHEIFHLIKRGKQHVQVGSVEAASPDEAMAAARKQFDTGAVVFNIWAIPKKDIRYTSSDEADLWLTLPEKKFRDATDYKGGQKLKEFLDRSK